MTSPKYDTPQGSRSAAIFTTSLTPEEKKVNAIISGLNKTYPGLPLKCRDPRELARRCANTGAGQCYERLLEYQQFAPERIPECLSSFHLRAAKSIVPGLTVLLDCLPRVEPQALAQGGTPIVPAGPTFADRIKADKPRATTPEIDEEDDVAISVPTTPSNDRKSHNHPRGTKRTSSGVDSKISPKFSKISSSSRAVVSATFSSSPAQQHTGLSSLQQKTPYLSKVLPRGCGQDLEGDRLTSSVEVRPRHLTDLANNGSPGLRIHPNEDSIKSPSKSTPRTENREPSHQTTLSPESHRKNHQVSSSVSLNAKLPLRSNSFGLEPCAQVEGLPTQGLFVPDYLGPIIEYNELWECQRWSSRAGVPIENLLEYCAHTKSYNQFVANLNKALEPSLRMKASQRSSLQAWQNYTCDKVQYKARLSFAKSVHSGNLFELTLLPLGFDKSCRLQRKYGSHRFLYVDVPDLKNLPDRFPHGRKIHDRFLDWLVEAKYFLARCWRAVHLEQSKAKKHDQERFGGYRVVFFAIAGPGLEEVSLEKFLTWFMDIRSEANLKLPFRKLAARVDLGFSKTTPTLVFKPSQVFDIDDVYADGTPECAEDRDTYLDWTSESDDENHENQVMTDGCGLISVGAVKQISTIMGHKGPLPSVLQGRIGGAKGVWTISGPLNSKDSRDLDVWIQIRKSQRKFASHESDNDNSFESERWTFEVLEVAEAHEHARLMGSLHLDMIPLLVDRGVPLENIKSVFSEALIDQDKNMETTLQDRVKTRRWVSERSQNMKEYREEYEQPDETPSFPFNPAQRANYLLDHGFNPNECPPLTEALKQVAEGYFDKTIKKLNVPLEPSVNLIGVADPLGVLEPNTVHVGFSRSFFETSSRRFVNDLSGLKALVTRFPMQMPSDIQKIRIVYNPKLGHLNDCLVFPTKGKVSLPSKLQGGDLDGDRFLLIWEPRLVDEFKNAPVPWASTPAKEFGVSKDSRTSLEVLSGRDAVEKFLRETFDARLKRVPLGWVSNFLKKLAYHLGKGAYRHPGVLKLSELYTLLIDADKQGHLYDDQRFMHYINSEYDIKQKQPPVPEFEAAITKGIEPEGTESKVRAHPNDIIYFESVRPRLLAILDQFDRIMLASKGYTDSVLTARSNDLLETTDGELEKERKNLTRQLLGLYEDWRKTFQENEDCTDVPNIIESFRDKYNRIQPANPSLPEISMLRLFNQIPSKWELLKASALYNLLHLKPRTKMIWQVAGVELSFLKVHSTRHVNVSNDIWSETKMRRAKAEPELEMEDDELDTMSDTA